MSEVIRINVFKYKKSGKLIAYDKVSNTKNFAVLDLENDLTLKQVRSVKYIKNIVFTKYDLDVEKTIEREKHGKDLVVTAQYKILRAITIEDTKIDKWINTKSLEKLPVLKHKHITEEEMVWAGKREGDFFGIIHGIFSSLFFYLSYSAYSNFKLFFLISISLAVLFLIWFIKYEWKFPKKANKDKLHELEEYKNNLIHNEKDKVKNSITSFQKKLKNFSTWKLISPKQFEFALAAQLKKENYDLKVSQYSGDGGIDLEGKNSSGKHVIIQAKQYKNNVGVAVVREMIGVRESHPNNPITMIISLYGFTKGAKELAFEEGIILRSIREDIINL